MNPQAPDNQEPISARRRLLRGSFAVPAVLTVASGSALAAKSATCLAKATTSSSTAVLTTTANADTFLRVRLKKRNNNNVHLFTRTDFGGIPVSLSFWNTNTVWQRFGIDSSNSAQFNKVYGSQQTNSVPDSSDSTYWAALRLNSAGEIVGLGLSGTGSVLGSSCWTSMATQQP